MQSLHSKSVLILCRVVLTCIIYLSSMTVYRIKEKLLIDIPFLLFTDKK